MALALTLFRLPRVMAWRNSAFEDNGANLTIEYLTRAGDRPGIDNGYIYGLLCLGFGQVWCGALGLTPYASLAAWAIGNVLVAWGMARFAYHARVGPAGLALMLIEMVPCKDQTFVYVLEPIFLVHALAEQARGRRGIALALVTACAFVKPSMASVFGLILLGTIFADRTTPARFRDRLRRLVPAAVVGVALVALFGAVYGVPVLIRSLVPVHAAAIYKASRFGFFFGTGRGFWYFPHVRWGYYVGTPTGFWLIGTVILIVGGIAGLVAPRGRAVRNREVVATCAALHAAFVCFFFAHASSYDYYYYVLVLGLAAMAPRSRASAVTVLLIAAIGLVGNRGHVLSNVQEWRSRRRTPETIGLFVEPGDRVEWAAVRRLIAGRRSALLSVSDGAALMVPELGPPTIYYMAPTELTPLETDRKLAQLASAELIVEALSVDMTWPSASYPVFRPPLEGRDLAFAGKLYRVYGPPLTVPSTGSDLR
jgi:hypothetical protein